MASTTEAVRIAWHRPPDRDDVFVQAVVHRTAHCIVTFVENTVIPQPVRVGDAIVLEPGAPAVWFTFPSAWHDIGRFHRADGTFTGLYANVLTPVRFLGRSNWETTDLFLDVWLDPDGEVAMLDADELDHAERQSWVSARLASAARREADRIRVAIRSGDWPPPAVLEWTLDRARRAADPGRGTRNPLRV